MQNESEIKPGRSFLLPIVVATVVLLVAAFFGVRAWRQTQNEALAAAIAEDQARAQAAIEDQWGIRVTQVAATADGGLVDLRYQITDPDKAIYLYDEVGNVPHMVAEDSGVQIAINNLPHQHDLEFGQTYFVIYRNIAGAIKPGGMVTVYVGDIGIEHFQVAQ